MTEQNYSKPRDRTILIRVNSKDLEAWDQFAQKNYLSRAELIRRSLRRYLDLNSEVKKK